MEGREGGKKERERERGGGEGVRKGGREGGKSGRILLSQQPTRNHNTRTLYTEHV